MDKERTESGLGIVRATIARTVETEMTMDRALQIINRKHAISTMNPEDLFIFRMGVTNQNLDTYFTRMAQSSLENYKADFTEGRAIMNSHRAGGWSDGELPIGRTFAAEISGEFLPSDAKFAARGGASLSVWGYIQRGLKVTDIATDDVIRGIEGGTISDVSLGFRVGWDGMYRCSMCGNDIRDYGSCEHFPGRKAKDSNERAFAWVEKGRAREVSFVYEGATPDAMVDKAIRMVGDGRMSRADAAVIEEEWGVRIVGGAPYQIIKPKGGEGDMLKKGEQRTDTDVTVPDVQQQNTDAQVRESAWSQIVLAVRGVSAEVAEKLESATDDAARHAAISEALGILISTNATVRTERDDIKRQQEEAEGKALAAQNERDQIRTERDAAKADVMRLTGERDAAIAERDALKGKAALGERYVTDLIEEAVKVRVGALGADGFDAERYRTTLRNAGDVDYIREEIKVWGERKRAVFGDGKRPTLSALPANSRTQQQQQVFPVRATARSVAAYR